ncbi:YiiG family protein [Tissierella sp. MSJ-40]|uniref:YiiG family protein n=1 Tax=Tissierella simiarum TaxID=2841534 RepID=A0ABS6E5S5_9FIRM|nr:DUF3829 domain-containing protein [Tissierella simiarum]MBU5438132.1 YiiG family protein [Tissierella simiarum]
MSKKKSLLILLFLLCFTITACNSTGKQEEEPATTSTEVSDSQADYERKIITKQNAYVNLGNFITAEYFNRIIDTYFSRFGTEEFVKPSSAPFVNAVAKHEIDLIDDALERSEREPYIEGFDESVQDLVPKLKNLISIMDEAHTYYKQKDYIDDDYAKGAEYHNQIVSIYFNEFYPSLEVFFGYMDELAKNQRESNMQLLVENDFMIRYHILDVLYKAQDIQSGIYDQNVSSENILELNLDLIKEDYEALIESINKLKEYSKDNKRLEAEGFDSVQMEQYIGYAAEVKAAITEIIQRVNDKNPVPESDIKHNYVSSTSGTPEKLDSRISALIDYYNSSFSR